MSRDKACPTQRAAASWRQILALLEEIDRALLQNSLTAIAAAVQNHLGIDPQVAGR